VTYALGECEATRPAAVGTGDKPVLTNREWEVAKLIAQGLTNKEIASALVIAPRTAEGHFDHILQKLGFGSRAQIADWAARRNDPAVEPGFRS
jgi:non-specific serine/threonine protein kinase